MDGMDSRLPKGSDAKNPNKEETLLVAVNGAAGESDGAPDTDESENEDDDEEERSSDVSSRSSNSNDDDHSSSGSEGGTKADVVTTSDGRVLSEYELLREERIRRNREYLASLGLERPVDESVMRQQRRNKRRPVQVKQRASQRERKSVDYTERKASLASIVREFRTPNVKAKPRKREPKPTESQKEKKDTRMERFIYREFQSVQAHKNHVLKQAEKDLRAAKREVKYWSKLVEKAENREKRREESSQHAEHGLTLREILREIDNRTSELVDAVGRYDEEMHAEEQAREQQQMRLVAENKLIMLNALERFPVTLKHSRTLLNTALLERAPVDPPPPRRSHRSARDEAASEPPKETESVVSRNEEGEPDTTDFWGSTSDAFLFSSELRELQRDPRNVGGWVSPAFSELLNRSWLDRDSPPNRFDPSTYVPQIGDCVLYYPIGHKEHLRHFPDVLGRQTGDASRVPLWERELQRGEEAANGSWLSEEWLSKMSRDDCQYPILCRVEATCPEFPPDPYVKEVKSQNRGDCDLVCWNVPKGSATLKRMSGTPLCLAVELRPMTTLIPPYEVRGARGDLTLPPLFTVVSFPTELDPFLIPFTWAYASHCLSRGDHCTRIDDEGSSTLRVEEFAFLAGTPPSWRLEHRATDVSSILSRFDESAAKLDTLKTLLASAPPEFPVREGRYIIEVLQRLKFHFDVDASNCLSGCVIDLFELIRNTLPLWESAAVVKLANKRKQHWVSPWLLVPHDDPEFFQDFTPSELSRLLTPLCSTLREKIVLMVDDVWGRFEDSDLFYYDISERDAPSYGCAVPVKTSFEKIIRRLGIGSQCFYRSADEVLSDAHMMWENCLLYNSPDSPVVESGIQIVAELREAILRTVMSHIQDRRDAQRYSKSSLCLSGAVRHDSGSLVTWDGCKSRPPPLSTVKNPFRDDIDNEWLQHISSPEMATRSSILPRTSEQQPCRNWFPQAGDQVMYSIENHKTFIVGHKAALDSAQCQLPCCSSRSQPKRCSDQENITRSPCSWCLGTVLWTKATFPRPASKKSPGEFLTTSTILAVGIRFQSEVETSVVYWRPCVFESDNIKDGDASCRVCGLRLSSSFLRSSGTSSTSLSEPLMSSLERCFILLKRRCIKQEDISSLDPSLTVENVMDGYTTPPVRIGPKSVPSFADRLIPRCKSLSPATRGVGSQCESESALKTLVEFGFLPSWMSSSLESAERVLKLHQMVSPCPKLSLELILLRLEEGFYRQTAAIENDVAEAYVNQVALLLSESTSRRKSPMSMRRIASGLQVTEDDRMWEKLDAPEEIEYSKRIAKIRDLHAMALFAIYETSHFERLLGLPLSSASLTEQGAHARSTSLRDLGRARTREGIEMLLSAVAKDLVQRSSNRAITTRIKVRCGGETVSYSRYFAKIARAEALLDGTSTSVKVICCGKLFTARKNDDEVCGVELDTSRESPMMSLNEMKVRVRCNDSTYGPRDLCAMIPGQLGDKSLTRVVETSIRCTRSEYEESNTLVRFLVGQPGRMDRCARCQVYQRSFYYCRVVRGHLNDDFDFAGFFASDAKGVDDLLQALHPANLSSTSAANSLGQVASHNEGSIGGQAHARPIATTNGDALCQGTPEVSPEVDPRANLERAQGAVSLASKLLQAAALYNKAPARLSHDFVSEAFPIDSSDGHYMYCVVCGLSGDLLCCDGCPNVVHQECINLTDVPEGDWFCDECNACTLAKDGTPEIGSPLPPPFGRVHFDDTEAEKLAEVLAGLFEARPDQKNGRADIPTKRSRGRPRHNQAGDGDEERDEEKGSDADSSVDGPPQKRRRGRPRKQHPSIALASMYNSPAGDTQTSMPTESDPRDSSKASENDSVKGQNSRPSRRNPRQAEVRQHNEGRETTQSIMVRGPEGVADGAMNLGEKRRSWRRSR